MIMQTGVRIPKSVFFSVSDFFQSALLTPGRLKLATLHAWGVSQQLYIYIFMSVTLRNAMQSQLHLAEYFRLRSMDVAKASRSHPSAVLVNERAGLRDYEGKWIMPCIGTCLEKSDRC